LPGNALNHVEIIIKSEGIFVCELHVFEYSSSMGYEGVPIETQLYLYTKDVTDSRLSKIPSGFHPPPAVERQVTRLFDDHHSPRCHHHE